MNVNLVNRLALMEYSQLKKICPFILNNVNIISFNLTTILKFPLKKING